IFPEDRKILEHLRAPPGRLVELAVQRDRLACPAALGGTDGANGFVLGVRTRTLWTAVRCDQVSQKTAQAEHQERGCEAEHESSLRLKASIRLARSLRPLRTERYMNPCQSKAIRIVNSARACSLLPVRMRHATRSARASRLVDPRAGHAFCHGSGA